MPWSDQEYKEANEYLEHNVKALMQTGIKTEDKRGDPPPSQHSTHIALGSEAHRKVSKDAHARAVDTYMS
eukprot:52483-Eustigmatos_ZCMA.PRE.1